MDRPTRRYLPAVAFAALLLVVSLVPTPETGGPPLPAPLGIALDKWVHAASYGALTGLLAWARRSREVVVVGALAAFAVGYGVGIELLQGLVPSRGTSGADAVANAVGAVGGSVLWLTLGRVGAGQDRQSEQ
ncbi:VanZ family protein [Haloarcula salinisoli]|uniref:VanZ family protein n=1 Tax=Haloarcula salinisoli TaxID=2487746 RepID=A0A8J8CC30_9EURY|nr:VanZ family protein [Halomicroarcula salinisoli]MBX0287343.1 VanZ family protein [Halomicroarcula salinisoli]MBX0305083.1 VanZ family protein [Halomicroarcula salinisoli]